MADDFFLDEFEDEKDNHQSPTCDQKEAEAINSEKPSSLERNYIVKEVCEQKRLGKGIIPPLKAEPSINQESTDRDGQEELMIESYILTNQGRTQSCDLVGMADTDPGEGCSKPKQLQVVNINHNIKMKDSDTKAMEIAQSSIPLPSAPSLRESFRYSLTTIFWLIYQSLVLGIIPVITVIFIFGSTWLFPITQESYLIYFTSTGALFTLCAYLAIFEAFRFLFHVETAKDIAYSVLIPLSILNISLFVVRQIFKMPLLSFGYYCVFLLYYFMLLKNVEKNNGQFSSSNGDERIKRIHILSSDGTPMALFKGFVPYIIVYYTSANYLVLYFMDSGIIVRILSRILVIPFLFSILDTYQNSLLVKKSPEYQKHRMLPANIMNSISVCILRLMITDSPHLRDTMVMTISASLFEIILRVSYIPRAVYSVCLLSYMKDFFSYGCLQRRKIVQLDNISPSNEMSSAPNSGNRPKKEERDKRPPLSEGNNKLNKMNVTSDGVPDIISIEDRKNRVSEYIQVYHMYRSSYISMFEIQSAVFIPMILFLWKPIQGYVTFQTFSSPNEMISSILIQLSAEILTQLTCLTLENYIYRLDVPVKRIWNYNFNPKTLIRYLLILLMSVYFSLSPFRPSTEHWLD